MLEAEKEESLFFLMGPPRVPPYMFQRSGGTVGVKKLRASNMSLFWTNSKPSPWNLLVPLFRITLKTAKPLLYSALKLLVYIWISSMAWMGTTV